MPGIVLRGMRMRGVPDGGGQHRPPLRAHRLLRPVRALPLCILGAPGGRGAAPPVHPMCVYRGSTLVDRVRFGGDFVRLIEIFVGIYFFSLNVHRD